ncbi:MAG: hypothetical protein CMN31_10625 [Sandaracinus sp.]|nr:hypothetical protein [Sandaracinus sp.]MBJ71777.1 hypothetical protein [Sandaracinus sp.]
MESGQARAYYEAALSALAYIEGRQPTGRRFGAEADARWSSFKGDLTTADRIDLLIRDADAQWPAAFGARTVFAKRAVAEDEPFGADWEPLDPVEAEEMWRARAQAESPASPRQTLEATAAAWDLNLTPFDPGTIGAAEKLVVAGPSAIAAAIVAFHEGSDLDWIDQVTVVATPPAHRQLAAHAGALLNATKPARIFTAELATAKPGARLLLSDDATDEDAANARELAKA